MPGLPYSCHLQKLVGCRQGPGTPAITAGVQGFHSIRMLRALKMLSGFRGSMKGGVGTGGI